MHLAALQNDAVECQAGWRQSNLGGCGARAFERAQLRRSGSVIGDRWRGSQRTGGGWLEVAVSLHIPGIASLLFKISEIL